MVICTLANCPLASVVGVARTVVTMRIVTFDTQAGTTACHDHRMNGFGTARTRPRHVDHLSRGWTDGNWGENRVVGILSAAGIMPALGRTSGILECHQQHVVGRYLLDFAWPGLGIAIEADGGIHHTDARYMCDRIRDAWLREHGWLVFRVDTSLSGGLEAQVKRVLSIVRALARS